MANPVKIRAIVKEAVKHTETLVSYRFTPQGRVPKFYAGQFMHIALDEYQPDGQWPESRVFSITASPAERKKELAATISVKGHFTQRIYEELNEGASCWLKLPYGDFLFPTGRHLTLIAGGVGITPYLSLLKQRVAEGASQSVTLHYGFRSRACYLFGELLERFGTGLPNFRATLYCEDGSVPGERGVLDIDAIRADSPDDCLYYLSGPPAMIDAFRRRLLALNIEKENIRVDEWG